jgi:hypothetical protein
VGDPPVVIKGEQWQIVPEQARIVQEVHTRYAQGVSLIGLAQWLNSEGILTREGHLWQFPSVRAVLGNPAYLGKNVFRGQVLPGKHEHIIDEELMAKVQARLAAARAVPFQSRAVSLSPILRCGACGGGVCRTGSGNKAGYGCVKRTRLPAEARHPGKCVPAAKIEEGIWQSLVWYLNGPFQAAWEAEERRRAAVRDSEPYRRDRERLAEVERKLEKNQEAFYADAITADLLAEWDRPLLADRQRLRDRLVSAEPVPAREGLLKVPDVDRLLVACRKQPADMQVDFLRRLFQRIEIRGNELVFVALPGGPSYRVTLPPWWGPQRRGRSSEFRAFPCSSLEKMRRVSL